MKKAIGVGLFLLGFVLAVNVFLPMVAQAEKAEPAETAPTVEDQLVAKYEKAVALYKEGNLDEAETLLLEVQSAAASEEVNLRRSIRRGIDRHLKLIAGKRMDLKKEALMARVTQGEGLFKEGKYEEAKKALEGVQKDAEAEGVKLGWLTGRKIRSLIKKSQSKIDAAIVDAEESRRKAASAAEEDAREALRKELVAKFEQGEGLYKDGKYREAEPVLREVSDACGKNQVSLGRLADRRLQTYLADVNDKIIEAAKEKTAEELLERYSDAEELYKQEQYGEAKGIFEDIARVQEAEGISLGYVKNRGVSSYIAKSEQALATEPEVGEEAVEAAAVETAVSEPAEAAPVEAVVAPAAPAEGGASALKKARAEAAYKAGLDAYIGGDFTTAQQQAYNALALVPGYPEATLLLESANKKLAELAAEKPFEALAEATKQARRVEISEALSNGRKAMVEEDYVLADAFFQEAGSIAAANIQMGFEDYLTQADKLREQIKDKVEAQLRAEKSEQERIARTLIDKEKVRALGIRKQQIKKLMESANYNLKQEDYGKAASDLDAVLQIDPNHAYARVLRELVTQWDDQKVAKDASTRRVEAVAKVKAEVDSYMIFATTPAIQFPEHWGEKTAGRENWMTDMWGGTQAPDSLRMRTAIRSAESEEVYRKLEKRLTSINFPNADFDFTIKFLRTATEGLNVVVDPNAQPSATTINLQLANVPARTVLELITKTAELEWTVVENFVYISTKEGIGQLDLPGQKKRRVYNVTDLIAPIEDWGSGGGQGGRRGGQGGRGGSSRGGGGTSSRLTGGAGGDRFFGGEFGEGLGGFGGGAGFGGLGGVGGVGGRAGGVGGQAARGGQGYSDLDTSGSVLAQEIMAVVQPDIWGVPPEAYMVTYLTGGRLVVYAEPSVQEEVKEFLAELRSVQSMAVMVETRIIRVSSAFLDRFSVNYPLIDFVNPDEDGAWTRADGSLLVGSTMPAGFATDMAAGAGEGWQFNLEYLDGIQVQALLTAVQKSTDSQTMNQPRVMLANGQMGYIEVDTQMDYISGFESEVAESAVSITPLTDTQQFGTYLTVRPAISYDGKYVQLAIEPDISEITSVTPYSYFTVDDGITAENTLSLLTTTDISLRSTVSVPDGGTAMLGGMTLAGEKEIETGVPILSSLPLIGKLFKNTGTVRDKSVVVFLVTPHIVIRDELEARL